jgi:hypothetical protein
MRVFSKTFTTGSQLSMQLSGYFYGGIVWHFCLSGDERYTAIQGNMSLDTLFISDDPPKNAGNLSVFVESGSGTGKTFANYKSLWHHGWYEMEEGVVDVIQFRGRTTGDPLCVWKRKLALCSPYELLTKYDLWAWENYWSITGCTCAGPCSRRGGSNWRNYGPPVNNQWFCLEAGSTPETQCQFNQACIHSHGWYGNEEWKIMGLMDHHMVEGYGLKHYHVIPMKGKYRCSVPPPHKIPGYNIDLCKQKLETKYHRAGKLEKQTWIRSPWLFQAECTVACKQGYGTYGVGDSSPTATCSADGEAFVFSGCEDDLTACNGVNETLWFYNTSALYPYWNGFTWIFDGRTKFSCHDFNPQQFGKVYITCHNRRVERNSVVWREISIKIDIDDCSFWSATTYDGDPSPGVRLAMISLKGTDSMDDHNVTGFRTYWEEPGKAFGKEQYDTNLFAFDAQPRSYAAAVDYCASLGRTIASIHSSEETSLAQSLMTTSAWLGASTTDGVSYTWEDGSPFDYLHNTIAKPDLNGDAASNKVYTWETIDNTKSCETNDDNIPFVYSDTGYTRQFCMAQCETTPGCAAIDFKSDSKGGGTCNLYNIACSTPTASGGESYRLKEFGSFDVSKLAWVANYKVSSTSFRARGLHASNLKDHENRWESQDRRRRDRRRTQTVEYDMPENLDFDLGMSMRVDGFRWKNAYTAFKNFTVFCRTSTIQDWVAVHHGYNWPEWYDGYWKDWKAAQFPQVTCRYVRLSLVTARDWHNKMSLRGVEWHAGIQGSHLAMKVGDTTWYDSQNVQPKMGVLCRLKSNNDFFKGPIGFAHVFGHFDVLSPLTNTNPQKVIHNLPWQSTYTNTRLRASVWGGNCISDAIVEFTVDLQTMEYLRDGKQANGWRQIHDVKVIHGRVPNVPQYMWTGQGTIYGWVLIQDTSDPLTTFASSYSVSSTYDYCNGAPIGPNGGEMVRLSYRRINTNTRQCKEQDVRLAGARNWKGMLRGIPEVFYDGQFHGLCPEYEAAS